MKNLNRKHCLITGAASGIGRATAQLVAREGGILYLTDVNAEGLAETCELIERECQGAVAFHMAADLSDREAVLALEEAVHRQQPSMDVLMNVAGISTWGTIENLEYSHWKQLVDINLMGPVQILEQFVPPMIQAGRGGHIVNVSSAAGLFGLPWHAAYSATKFGLRGISEVLRFDLRQHNIGVSLVCPGAVDTGLVRTINIVGVDRNHPEVAALTQKFQRHAVTPEKAARAILKGIRKNRYMVFTSPDIQVGYWFQRKFAWPYEWVMRLLSWKVTRVMKQVQKMDGQ